VDACCLALLHHTRAWPPRISSFAKQLAFYAERRVKPRRLDDATATHAGRPRPIHRVATAPQGRPTGDARAKAPTGFAYSGGGGHGGVGVRRFLRTSRH
jgi:hypothetical protein